MYIIPFRSTDEALHDGLRTGLVFMMVPMSSTAERANDLRRILRDGLVNWFAHLVTLTRSRL